ncbi:MAG: riboflavin synthase [Heliobacteriaceae bacterium]|nr:riboflavin synthase [Heliobacteriaceae bacterium]MDD4586990.1 riboflavin synthase [Heliobacteriaceae bacterium]
MFTGIIEEMGTVKQVQRGSRSAKLTVQARQVLDDVKLGDSIAVNGVCLTVVAFDPSGFTADVMAETLDHTVLADLRPGSRVNLERALRVGDRLGGHIVSGHVDEVGLIKGQSRVDIAVVTEITCSPRLRRYVVPKGSIAIDGISLTVAAVTNEGFTISLIPHTAGLTTLGVKKSGDRVNLEADILGKYVERLLTGLPAPAENPATNLPTGQTSAGVTRLTRGFLLENGF